VTARRRGLGRGLGALIKDEEPGVRSLPVEALRPNRLQPRTSFDDDGLDDLAESIRAQGVIQPLVVRQEPDGQYTIVAGERRWRAAQRAGLVTVPAVVRDVEDDRALLEIALVENLQREDLNPVEEAEAYHALQDRFGLSQEEVAQRVGKGRSTVANSLRLLRLPVRVRDLLRAGQLTPGQARPLLGIAGEAAQVALAERALEEGLTARDLEKLCAAPPPEPKPRLPRPALDVNSQAAQEKLTRRFQTKVEIHRRGKGGQLRIHFHSEEELIRLYDLLMEREERA
jgi:ParB family chromosome partitioning protein